MPATVLSAVIIVGHLALLASDELSGVLFLQPAYTVTRPHQVVTAGIFEDSQTNLVLTLIAVLYSAKLLQPEHLALWQQLARG